MGPDRAAAEWVLRNGGKVKLSVFNNWTTDYNRLPAEGGAALEAIDGQEASLIDVGLDHLGELHASWCLCSCMCVAEQCTRLILSCNPSWKMFCAISIYILYVEIVCTFNPCLPAFVTGLQIFKILLLLSPSIA